MISESYEKSKAGKFESESAFKLVSSEYREILSNLKSYQLLYRFKFLDGVANLQRLSDLIGCGLNEVVSLERNLDAYFCSIMGGAIRNDLLDFVCPSCFRLSLTNYSRDGEEIKKTCSSCGLEVDESVSDENYDQSIEFGSTFAPESKLSVTKGLGNTLNHKKYLHQLLHDYNVDFAMFKRENPEIANSLLLTGRDVTTNGRVYHLMGGGTNVVRSLTVQEYYDLTEKIWHSFDKPLRKTLTHLNASSYHELKGVLDYAEQICDRYGLKRDSTSDQIVRNTLGCDIRRLRPQLKAQRKYVTAKRLAETLFYRNLLLFKKKEVALAAKPYLDIDVGLLNYYDRYLAFLRDNEKPDNSQALLNCIEQRLFGNY
jgi:hypothetical protein